MTLLYFILALLAVVCFAVATFFTNRRNAASPVDPLGLIALGLALWAAIAMLQLGQRL